MAIQLKELQEWDWEQHLSYTGNLNPFDLNVGPRTISGMKVKEQIIYSQCDEWNNVVKILLFFTTCISWI